jgi:epoxyqueuosine reductase
MLDAAAVCAEARTMGFDVCGVAAADAFPELERLRDWLDRGYAGEMAYLHKSAETRADIRRFLPSARSVVVTGTVYHTRGDGDDAYEQAREPRRLGRIARYAWGEDYHHVLVERLERLVAWMRTVSPEPFEAAIFADKHHVQERAFAARAGLGWIGKNTCLIHPDTGSWLFLAGVAVSLDLDPGSPQMDRCGACTLCLDACPTGALVDAYELDATRCISYLTIELHGPIPAAQRPGIADHLFGCDICQEVCPWNLAPLATLDPAWRPRQQRDRPDAAELWQRDDAGLHALIRSSAMTRVSVSRLRRNLAVVLGNSGNPSAGDVLARPGRGVARAAPSAATPLVTEHVAWARRQVASASADDEESRIGRESARLDSSGKR